jgi:hypothetical protein
MTEEDAKLAIGILEELKGQPKEVVFERITNELAKRRKLTLVPKNDPPKRAAQ